MRKTKHVLYVLLAALFLQGCASIMQGSTQHISVTTVPSGATVLVNGIQRFTSPAMIELPRRESHRLDISLEGYHPEVVDVRHVPSNMTAGNIIAGGLVGYFVDQSTGAAFRLVPEVVQINLRPLAPELEKAATVPAKMEEGTGRGPN
ncbi:MAG: PEGA domain-containing protein [Deltaproteobacteria bacterium]|nr:PEGA domain-containing protein [Deltaproteobacteria bacterium]